MKKFLFTHSFDEEVIARHQAEEAARLQAELLADENAPPTYSVEELETAKQIAHQQGLQEGKAEAMASIEQQASLTLELVLRKIDELLAEYHQWTAEVQHDSISMSLAIMRKLAPELLRGTELPQVEHVVNEAFKFLTDQPKVMIRVATEIEDGLRGKVNLMASRVGYEGQVVLTGDPELELTDCRISWYAGAVERALDETWGQIDEMVDRVLRGLPAREQPVPMPEEDLTDDQGAEEDDEDTILDIEDDATDVDEPPHDDEDVILDLDDATADIDGAPADADDNPVRAAEASTTAPPPGETELEPAASQEKILERETGQHGMENEDLADAALISRPDTTLPEDTALSPPSIDPAPPMESDRAPAPQE